MKTFYSNIKNNALIKLASFNSISVSIRIIAGFITSKVIAIYIGAEGLALIGNLRNFVNSLHSVSLLGTQNGLVKYVAEYKKRPKGLTEAFSTISVLVLIATSLISVFLFLFSTYISFKLLGSEHYSYIIKLFALVLPFQSLNKILMSLINGFSQFKTIVKINIASQILGALITLALILVSRIKGALIAIVIVESTLVVFTLTIAIRHHVFSLLFNKRSISVEFIKKIAVYSGMALFSAIMLPFVTVLIRNYIIDNIGVKEAGFWEAMNRVSGYYLMFMNSLIGIYILPKLSSTNSSKVFKEEVFAFYKNLIPIFGLGLILIYFLRYFIINLVFTKEFEPVEQLFFWQLLGDFVRILSVVIAGQFIAKRMFKAYIISEAIYVFALYLFSIVFINKFGVKGANIAYLIAYLIYFLIVLMVFRRPLFAQKK